ncbi:MAG: cytochrome c biogenesis protein CcdA [bacterium]
MHKNIFYLLLFNLTIFSTISAQIKPPEVVKLEAFLSVDKIRKGDAFKIGIKAKIDDAWHINSNKPLEDFLIPTVVEFDEVKGLEFGEVSYPEGELKRFAFSDNPLSVYEAEILISTDVITTDDFRLGERKLTGRFSYQACNDVSCLAPTKIPFAITTFFVDADTPIHEINKEKFLTQQFELEELKGERASTDDKISQLISGSGLFVTLLIIFFGGLALNLTPCVYPIIPITISFFVGQASGKISKSFLLALIYVIGISITYSLLGVLAAMTGGLLGSSLQNPLVLIGIAVIFLIFASSMFGAFEIRVPTFLSNFAGGSKQGFLGSLFMGLTVGIVAAPCIGPFVVSLLTFVAAKGDRFLGFLMFFILSLGLGLPYLFLGTFSGLIKNLPRSGEWLVWIKKVFGVIMIGVALYFISTLIPEMAYIVLLTATAILGGLFVGFIDKSIASFNWYKNLKSGVGIVMILFGIWVAVSAFRESNTEYVHWENYNDALVSEAKTAGRPVIIDFYADWCIPCKQIEKNLFTDPAIVEKAENFMTLKADLTNDDSEQVKSIRKKYKVLGVPTVIIIDSQGKEYKRFTDELVNFKPEEFLIIMNDVGAKRLGS